MTLPLFNSLTYEILMEMMHPAANGIKVSVATNKSNADMQLRTV